MTNDGQNQADNAKAAQQRAEERLMHARCCRKVISLLTDAIDAFDYGHMNEGYRLILEAKKAAEG